MKKIIIAVSIFVVTFTLKIGFADAHFGMIIPSDDMVMANENKTITLDVMFIHPMEGHYMNMEKPARLGVSVRGKTTDLLGNLREITVKGGKAWRADYTLKRPGDHIFYVEPTPYWEPAEDCYIIHYTKVVVNGFGMEQGWDEEVGLKTEIVPLTRPYGLWTGNVFQGIVKVEGKVVPYAEVEVEYYNKDNAVTWPADPMITQVTKADGNGVFTYAMPKAGWWGFAALNEDMNKIKHNGEDKPVEIGAVIWVQVYDIK
jgi:cobalt/nickel transport protein